MKDEAEVIINGIRMGDGCALTIRVAIEVFAAHLVEKGCGEDEHGKQLCLNYMDRINDIRRAMGIIE